MGKKVFVGGLSWNVDDDSLAEVFGRYGNVRHAKVVTDRETGKSRGFGFVTFDESAAADDAITAMDGREIDGRVVRVNEAVDKPPQKNFG